MATASHKFSVGLFVITAVSLIVIFMLFLGISDFFRDGHKYVAYFEDSVRGLNQGGKVSYRGVQIGRVESIRVAPDGRLVAVIMRIDSQVADLSELVASVEPMGITGIMYVELERRTPDRQPEPPELAFEPEYPVIATRPSAMTKLIDSASSIIATLEDVRITEISRGIETALDNVNRILVKGEIEKLTQGLRAAVEKTNVVLEALDAEKLAGIQESLFSATNNLDRLATDARATAARLDVFVETNTRSIEQTIAEAGVAAQKASVFFGEATDMVHDTDLRLEAYDQRLAMVVGELQQAAGSLNRLLDQLSNHPSQLVFGRPAPAKPIER